MIHSARLVLGAALVGALFAVSIGYAGAEQVFAGTAVGALLVGIVIGLAEFGPALTRRYRHGRGHPASHLRIFVSYSKEHEQQARRLAKAMEVSSADVWLDELPEHLAAESPRGRSLYQRLIDPLPHSQPLYRQLRAGGVGADRLEAADVLVLVGYPDQAAASAEIRLARQGRTTVVRVDLAGRGARQVTAVTDGGTVVDVVVGRGQDALEKAAQRVLAAV